MTIVYETPDKTWQIRKTVDSLWQEVFGKDIVCYNVCKYEESLKKWNDENNNFLADYVIIYSTEKIKTAFQWLKTMNIISNDECLFQISSTKEI